jgi:hypothetical protein
MTRVGIVVLILLFAPVAAACGGDDEDETAGQETVTQEEFTVQATEICARVNEELNQVQNFRQEAPPVIEEGLADLEALTPPPGEEETFNQFIQAGRDGLEQVERAQRPQQDPFDEFTRLGEQLGIEGGCTEAGQSPG